MLGDDVPFVAGTDNPYYSQIHCESCANAFPEEIQSCHDKISSYGFKARRGYPLYEEEVLSD